MVQCSTADDDAQDTLGNAVVRQVERLKRKEKPVATFPLWRKRAEEGLRLFHAINPPNVSEFVLAAETLDYPLLERTLPGQEHGNKGGRRERKRNTVLEMRRDDQTDVWNPVVWSGSGSQRSRPSVLSHGGNKTVAMYKADP